MHNFFSIKFAYEKYILHRNKQSFQNKIHLLHKHTGGPTILYCKSIFVYTEQYKSKQCTSQQAFIVKTESSLWTKDKLQRTNYKWTKAPQYNKCWNLEFLQDNSKALAGRCLEEWVTTLQNCERTGDKVTSV